MINETDFLNYADVLGTDRDLIAKQINNFKILHCVYPKF
jgi:hypothetical protein